MSTNNTEITVQFYEDGTLAGCNHAGANIEMVEVDDDVWDEDSHRMHPTGSRILTAWQCDKCDAWRMPGTDKWLSDTVETRR